MERERETERDRETERVSVREREEKSDMKDANYFYGKKN